MTSKLRTTVALLVATSTMAVATAPITPVANARPNIPGRFDKSSEGRKHQRMPQESCDNDSDRYNQLVDAGESFLLNNQVAGANAAFDAAAHVRDNAKKGGCSWAQ
jgi:hypothetical protein